MRFKSIVKHSIFSVAGLGLSAISAVCSNILIARTYSLDIAGDYFTANSIAVWFSAIAAFGIPDLLIREFHPAKSSHPTLPLNALYKLVSLVALVSSTALFLILTITNAGVHIGALSLVPLLAVPIRLIVARYRLMSNYFSVFLALIVTNVIKLAIVFLSWLNQLSFTEFCLILSLVLFSAAVIAWGILFWSAIHAKNQTQCNFLDGIPYLLGSIIGVGRTTFDLIMISYMLGPSAAAVYLPAVFPAKRTKVVAQAISDTAMLPKLMKLAHVSTIEFKKLAMVSAAANFIIGIFVGLLFALIAPFILGLFGPQYSEALPYYYAMTCLIPFRFSITALSSALKHRKSAKGRVKDQTASLVVMFLLIFLMTPTYELWGGVFAVIFSDIMLLLLYIVRFLRIPN